jgi:protein gp37
MFKSFNNVMFGVSVEDNETAIYRLPQLLTMYEPNRFISVEPLLGKIDLTPYLHGIKWVICGCESGSNRRHADINWIRDLRDQCVEANVPFFLKQMEINGKVVKMPELDGKVWDQTPLRYSPSGWWVDPVNVYEEAKP